ncbi:MAG: hypothetical protein ACLFTV_06485 [Desulfococcaceae bacterium]
MEKPKSARDLMDAFARRTGLAGAEGDSARRYLWTDAFAVQCFLGLARMSGETADRDRAPALIEKVHHTLGRHRADDPREGWISGLTEAEGRNHPAIGGLRIGKKLPERGPNEPFDERREWDRDGQYFHYLTKWINALLKAAEETEEEKFAIWAGELFKAGGKFIRKGSPPRMYWKMSIDLSHPLVPRMGAHDPLDGLICAEGAIRRTTEMESELQKIRQHFETLAAMMDWATADALGIGGLLLDTAIAAELALENPKLPESIQPRKLWEDSLTSLRVYADRVHSPSAPAAGRLAFRECGLSLGIRVLSGTRKRFDPLNIDFGVVDEYLPLADEIETFWRDPANQKAETWTGHLDINAVTLAASLIAADQPKAFVPLRPGGE